MNPEEYLIETGKTVEEAISKAMKKLNCTKNEVEISILDKGGKKRFLGLLKTPVTVKISLKDNLAKIRNIIEEILSFMQIEGEIFEKRDGSKNILSIYTAGYDGLLIGKGGKTLDAIQYIVSKMAKKTGIDIPFYITVGDYKRPYNREEDEFR